jgi:hypothetical protein
MDRAGIPDQRRDALLLKLLKTPPQPRPKRERAKKSGRKKLLRQKQID